MKYAILSWLRGFIASITAFFTACGAHTAAPEPVRPDANAVSAFSAGDADFVLTADAGEEVHDISDLLFGVFFEDINFAADGGLYAEMVANRSFEFTSLAKDDGLYHYAPVNGAGLSVLEGEGLNVNNPHVLSIRNDKDAPAGVENVGFMEGMAIEAGKTYRVSVYLRSETLENATLRLVAGDSVVDEVEVTGVANEWNKFTGTLSSDVTATENVRLQVLVGKGEMLADMLSLFPTDTYKNRENGLRRDLCERLEALQPKFLRFPGGCVIEGYGPDTAYSWKNSVGAGPDGLPLEFNGAFGDVAARKQGVNLWTDLAATDDPWPSFMSYGLGFYEFFQLCEDLGASPVPVLNAALYCQMRGQHGEEDEAEIARYIDDLLDLVEFARGDENTTWGKVRVSLGHPAPFDLHYIAVGNENEAEEYFVRYSMFLDAFKAAREENPALYEGVELIYSAGAADAVTGWNHEAAYEYAKNQLGDSTDVRDFAGAIDEHYYQSPEWFLQNADYYDEQNYTRTVETMTDTIYGGAIPVFLGEYAARSNTMKAALAEAAYMTGLERNGDIVRMAAYAPLFASSTARHWAPDLIWFNNHSTTASVNYYVQQLFSNHTGKTLLKSTLSGAEVPQKDLTGRVGLGTWYTAAEFDNLLVTDNGTGKTLIKDNFTLPAFWWNWENPNKGDFKIKGGKLVHVGTGMNWSDIGDIAYTGVKDDMKNYTLTVDATKTEGDEGFLIAFAVGDRDNNWFWNLGGWGNTVSCLQQMENGVKTGQIKQTVSDFTVETGRTYRLKVEVSGTVVRCWADDQLLVDYDTAHHAEAECYHVVSRAENGDLIMKLVNVTDGRRTVAVDLQNAPDAQVCNVYELVGASYDDENLPGAPEACGIREFTIDLPGSAFNYTLPAMSVTVLRFAG